MTGSLVLTEPELKTFIRERILQLLPLKDTSVLTDDADFFALGMDSLQSTQLRSVLVKTIDTNGHKVGMNVAFEQPSINLLARHITDLSSGTTNGVESVEDQMAALISQYSNFNTHTPCPNGLNGKYIVSRSIIQLYHLTKC